MKKYLDEQGITLSPKVYFIDALGAMAFGLFASLLVGTILNSIGNTFNIPFLTERIWPLVGQATGAAIAVSIAYALKAPNLVLFASTIVGLGSYELGGPVGVYIATIFATEFGKLVSKRTKLDIIITPTITILVGILVGDFIGPGVAAFMTGLGNIIMKATELQPFLMGIVVAVLVGVSLTLPISSAAICMMLSLSGIAGGAATVGCSAQMIGFAVISYKDNGMQGLLAQGLGTSMFQVPNIIKNPWIALPPTLAGAILGPVSTLVFKMENSPLGSGMGTSGLVGQISTINTMAANRSLSILLVQILLLHFILPALISYITYKIMYKKGLIKDNDMKINF
ncbi:MAG: PTS sugar transporter subunit IIC [Anaerococcus sp.]|uniref:PTS transporter subunit IIC n=1 Tax=Anaerococcus sp. TaxID=1872515 RepID=UPI002914B54D|nr:PTS sugar transporter subunit IIC [Anaerococcus sp.]MDU4025965.1 PTS sugar transporter subunit IIC [Anaerococcus sp.]MDU5229187.1 PTS sugar transporter subunit IIC [Anaerococcus sp.]